MNRPSFLISAGVLTLGSILTAMAGVAPAFAGSFVPQTEGEINVGAGGGPGFLATPGISSIVSLVDASNGFKNRLFVDKAGTANTYGAVKFDKFDVGTAALNDSYWFRPVSVEKKGGSIIENGQLEVGTFKFSFANTISKLKLSFFDTEFSDGQLNRGTRYSLDGLNWTLLPAGANKNIQQFFASNVSTLYLDLGESSKLHKTGFSTGDGVLFKVESVPEPMTLTGLVAVGAALASRRRKVAQ